MAPRKRTHEFRDPIHTFIKVDARERAIIDSAAFQRLRHIHQLSLTYLVYPGATHRRFEHSLGVMELAGQVFDIVTDPENVHFETVRNILPDRNELPHWRRVVRAAALCHDMGHLPFSHGAEKQLLKDRHSHEDLSLLLIECPSLRSIWDKTPQISPEDVKKIAVGKKHMPSAKFTEWEAILSEVITGDAFGVDRMDYLLRDSFHAGVAYGRFDHHRLVQSLRILPKTTVAGGSEELVLGIDIGGLHSAEALLLARYFMYEQVYFHPVRRIYDTHLIEFMVSYFGDAGYPFNADAHLAVTDNDILSAMALAAADKTRPGHEPALLIMTRNHFKEVYHRAPRDIALRQDAPDLIFHALAKQFGAEKVRKDSYRQKSNVADFPVFDRGEVSSSAQESDILLNLPVTAIDFVFCSRDVCDKARDWLHKNREKILN
jgi:uncharacterized protein